jgi:hypothetical protein
MKNVVFWDVTPCGSCKNRRFEERIASIVRMIRIHSSATLVFVTATRRNIPEDGILHSVELDQAWSEISSYYKNIFTLKVAMWLSCLWSLS